MGHTDGLNATHGHCPTIGSLFGGSDLGPIGPIGLIHIPEPSSLLLALLGIVGLLHWSGDRDVPLVSSPLRTVRVCPTCLFFN